MLVISILLSCWLVVLSSVLDLLSLSFGKFRTVFVNVVEGLRALCRIVFVSCVMVFVTGYIRLFETTIAQTL